MSRYILSILFCLVVFELDTHPLHARDPITKYGGKSVNELVKLLKNRDADERREAAWGLWEIGPEAINAERALIASLEDLDSEVRRNAAMALGRVAPKSRVANRALAKLIDDRDARMRCIAVEAVGRSGFEDVVTTVVTRLKDDNANVRSSVIFALGRIGPEAKGVIPALVEALDDKGGRQTEIRYKAAEVLLEFGPKAKVAVPALVEALKQDDGIGLFSFRMIVAEALWRIAKHPGAITALEKGLRARYDNGAAWRLCRIGSAAVPALTAALRDKQTDVRIKAATALHDIGPVGRPAIPTLIQSLQDESATVRVRAARALWSLDQHPAAITAIAKALGDLPGDDSGPEYVEKLRARSVAVKLLAEIGPKAKAAVPALARVLSDRRWNGRYWAARSLREMGPAAKDAVPALVAALKDKDRYTRRAAVYALQVIGLDAKPAIPSIENLLKDDDLRTRLYAAEALWWLDKDPQAIPVLISLLESNVGDNRSEAAKALGRIGRAAKTAVPALARALHDKEKTVRSAAATALEAIGIPSKLATAALIESLKKAEFFERLDAAKVLWRLEKNPAAVAALVEILKDENEPRREEAAVVLGQLKPTDRAARSALIEAIKDKDRWVRLKAAHALWRIEKHPSTMPTLLKALQSKNVFERSLAMELLVAIGPAGKAATSTLVNALKHDEDTNMLACRALGKIAMENKEIIPILVEALAHPAATVRQEAAKALGSIGPAAKVAINSLIKGFGDEDLHVRSLVAKALKSIDPQAAVKAGVR